jgi:hypothetical protein
MAGAQARSSQAVSLTGMPRLARLDTKLLPLGKILSMNEMIQARHRFAALRQE